MVDEFWQIAASHGRADFSLGAIGQTWHRLVWSIAASCRSHTVAVIGQLFTLKVCRRGSNGVLSARICRHRASLFEAARLVLRRRRCDRRFRSPDKWLSTGGHVTDASNAICGALTWRRTWRHMPPLAAGDVTNTVANKFINIRFIGPGQLVLYRGALTENPGPNRIGICRNGKYRTGIRGTRWGDFQSLFTLAASSQKRNVTVWRTSVYPSVCLSRRHTHRDSPGAAVDAARSM